MLDHQGAAQLQFNVRLDLPAPVAMYADTSAAAVLSSEALTGVPTTVRMLGALFYTFPDAAPGANTNSLHNTPGFKLPGLCAFAIYSSMPVSRHIGAAHSSCMPCLGSDSHAGTS